MFRTTNAQDQVFCIPENSHREWISASGPLLIPMTNDYLFRALLQRNNHVLKGLICALLHLSREEVSSVAIVNPIILGEAIDEKTFFWIFLLSLIITPALT